MKYKALFSDVDGTLVESSEALPSKKVIEAIQKAQERGVHIGVATSRPYQQMKKIFEILNLKGPSVMSAGAEIRDAQTGAILKEYYIDTTLIEPLFKILKDFDIPYYIQDNGIDREYTS